MAKLYFDGVCVMHDLVENVSAAYAAMLAAGSNVTMQED